MAMDIESIIREYIDNYCGGGPAGRIEVLQGYV